MRYLAAALVALAACTPSPAPAPLPPDASDAATGTLHRYTCSVGDASWACADGVTVPVGTCPAYCTPVGP